MTLLEYSVTRSIPLSQCKTVLVVVLGTIFVGLSTLINVIAVGYELVPSASTTYNTTYSLWYERLLPTAWYPESRTCSSAIINLVDRKPSLQYEKSN